MASLIWRAFVYDMKPGYDRAGAAYENLQPFDGKFAANVLFQVKNGPIDFQPREPFHPLFGSMPKTQVIPELQITQEYLGFSNHLVFLAQMWREVLDSDTYAKGKGSTVTQVADGCFLIRKSPASPESQTLEPTAIGRATICYRQIGMRLDGWRGTLIFRSQTDRR